MSRRARPTLRVLKEDLGDGWGSPAVLRALDAGEVSAVQPLAALDHPILRKASDSFGNDPAQDSFVGPIASVSSEVLLEIKQGQWRAGVWIGDDACWVVAAGLAKGGHQDRDDFYTRLERLEGADALSGLLPSDQDRRLLRKERAHALISAWQLQSQERIIETLSSVLDGGSSTLTNDSPLPDAPPGATFATVDLTVAVSTEPGDCYEDVVIEIAVADRWKNSGLIWPFTTHLLAAISPPEQGWDVAGGIYSNLLEIGALAERLGELRALSARQETATSVSGATSHDAHRRNLAESAVEGRATRALCGVYFVPRQDTDSLATCAACAALYQEIPGQ